MRLVPTLALAATLAAPLAFAAEVKVTLRNPSSMAHDAWPMTTGVPFPKDTLTSADQVALFDAQGKPVPVQTRITSTWGPEASARWLLLDFQAPIKDPEAQYTIRFGPDVKPLAPAADRRVTISGGADAVDVNTGPLQASINRKGFNGLSQVSLATPSGKTNVFAASASAGPSFVHADGRVFRASLGQADSLEIEETGALRVVVSARGWFYDNKGDKSCQYIVRYHFYAGQPFVKTLFTFLITEPTGKAAFRDIRFDWPIPAAQAILGGDPAGARDVKAGPGVYLLQYDCDKLAVKSAGEKAAWDDKAAPARSPGWATAATPQAALTLACRDFWQQFPKEFGVSQTNGLSFHVWPAHGVAKPGRKVEDANIQYLWFVHEGETLDFTVPQAFHTYTGEYTEYQYRYLRSSKQANVIGLAKTHELLAWFHPAGQTVAKTLEAWQREPVVMASPEWMCASGVFGKLHPVDTKRFPDIEAGLSRAWDTEQRLQDLTRDYGMFIYGDGHTTWDFSKDRWSDVYRSWRAYHHGAPRVPWVLYLRSGDPKYFWHGLRSARFLMDIGMCNYTTPELDKLDYPVGKILGGLNDYKGIVPWHSGSRLMDYNICMDFMLYYYYMTGDRRGLDVATMWGESVKKKYGAPFGSRSAAGTISSLVEVYKATWDPELKRIAQDLVNHFLDKVQVMNTTTPAIEEVVKSVPQFKDKSMPRGAFVQWENYAPWIEAWYDLTGDKKTGERIAAWADAYLEGWGDAWTSLKVGAEINVFAYAWFVTKDVKYLDRGAFLVDRYISAIEKSPGSKFDGFPHIGQISLGSGYMAQRIPVFLAALADYGKPIIPALPEAKAFNLLFRRERKDGKKIESVTALIQRPAPGPFTVIVEGGTTYNKWPIRITIASPSGKTVYDKEHVFNPGGYAVKAPVSGEEKGVYKLTVTGEGSFWSVQNNLRAEPASPIVFPFAGHTLRLDACRYYFLVPPGVKSFKLNFLPIGGSVMASLRDPSGAAVFRKTFSVTDKPETQAETVTVKPEHAGKAWMLEGWAGFGSLELSAPLPPFLALQPDQLFTPAK